MARRRHQIRPKVPKFAAIMEEAETDVLAYMTFPKGASPQVAQHEPDRARQR